MASRVPIIPGVPTPSDPQCSLTYCGRIIAQVDCIKYIVQGTSACIDIQLFGSDDLPLNLDNFCDIHIQLTNELDCVVANFWWPNIPSGSKGFLIDILQFTDTSGVIHNEGLIRVCLPSTCTNTSPGNISAEILLTECGGGNTGDPTGVGPTGALPTGSAEVFGIPCLWVATIVESKIAKNGGDSGCYPGYVPGGGGSSGGGGSTPGSQGAQGSQGSQGPAGSGGGGTGTQGAQGAQGLAGLGTQGITGSQGIQGTQGITGAGSQGTQGTQGITGSQGIQGTQGITGAGSQGTQGTQGITGSQGIQGITGTGSQGTQGTQGITGSQGTIGTQGTQGITGSQGTIGSQGTQGIQGITGSQGTQGTQGITGSQGTQGITGSQGTQGTQGITGSQGTQGTQGITGSQGTQGTQGITGTAADTLVTTNTQSNNYTLVLGDRDKIVEMSNASTRTITVPPNSSIAFPIGSQVMVARGDTGSVQILEGAGVTIDSSNNHTYLQYQYSGATLIKKSTNGWWLFGDLTTIV